MKAGKGPLRKRTGIDLRMTWRPEDHRVQNNSPAPRLKNPILLGRASSWREELSHVAIAHPSRASRLFGFESKLENFVDQQITVDGININVMTLCN
jgi:hypothetical protein